MSSATRATLAAGAAVAAALPGVVSSAAGANPLDGEPPVPGAPTTSSVEPPAVATAVGEVPAAGRLYGRGRSDVAADIAARFTDLSGTPFGASDVTLVEYRDPDGSVSYVATTDPATLDSMHVTAEGGMSFDVTASATGSGGAVLTAAAADDEAPHWKSMEVNCAARVTQGTGDDMSWLDHCWNFQKLQNDGEKSFDVWAIHHYGTSNNAHGAFIGTHHLPEDDPTPYTAWIDWSPKADSEREGCVPGIPITIAYILELTFTTEQCENHLIVKGSPSWPGVFGQLWYSSLFGDDRKGNREVSYSTAGKVPEGAEYVSAGFTAELDLRAIQTYQAWLGSYG